MDAGCVVHAGQEGEGEESGEVIEFAGWEGDEDWGPEDEAVGDVVFETLVVGFAEVRGGGLVGHFVVLLGGWS